MRFASICFAFFLSGISALIYQVVWVRSFGNIFGNTIYSSALVTGIFMCGLGFGSFFAGRIADRAYAKSAASPLLFYAASEFLIGIWALGLAFLLPQLEAWLGAYARYSMGANAWQELNLVSQILPYSVALLLLLPITFLLGGTLSFLVRVVAQDLRASPWPIGVLYGINTAGAAAGAFLSDFILVPNLGLFATQEVAVLFSFSAGGIAWLCFSKRKLRAREIPEADPPSSSGERSVYLSFFLSGFAGMGVEIVWFRFLSSALGQLRSVFSLLLAILLLAIWLGSTSAGWFAAKTQRPKFFFLASQCIFAATLVLCLFAFDVDQILPPNIEEIYRGLGDTGRSVRELLWTILAIARLVALPAFFMGWSFPLANALAQKSLGKIGQRVGMLYLGNTLGALLGSLVAGFIFLPYLGMKWSAFACALLAVASTLPLRNIREEKWLGKRWGIFPLCFFYAAALSVLAAWIFLPRETLIQQSFRGKTKLLPQPVPAEYLKPPRLVHASEGLLETIVVLEEQDGGRGLYTDGHNMSSSVGEAQRYMRAMAHIPLLMQEHPKNALVICFGVGNTLHAASLHPDLERLEVVDLSKHVLGLADLFRATNGGVLGDPRVSVFVNDGRAHLHQGNILYDLITLEPPPLAFAGIASLYSQEFYRLAHNRLSEQGYITQWLPIKQVSGPVARAMIRAFTNVFPNAVLLSGELGNFILLGKKSGPIEFDPAQVAKNLQEKPMVLEDLQKIRLAQLQDIAGTFIADSATLKRVAGEVEPITDDHPTMEYVKILFLKSRVPTDLFGASYIQGWCPKCFAGVEAQRNFPHLLNYSKILAALYKQEYFLLIDPFPVDAAKKIALPIDKGAATATIRSSPYLRGMLKK